MHIHAVEFDYLCQGIEPATVMSGNPQCAQLLVDSLVIGPKKWLRSGHFLASQTGSGRRRKSSAPVVSDSSSAYEESDTYRGNWRNWRGQHGARYRRARTKRESEVRVRGSYFGVRVGAEQSHEVIEVM